MKLVKVDETVCNVILKKLLLKTQLQALPIAVDVLWKFPIVYWILPFSLIYCVKITTLLIWIAFQVMLICWYNFVVFNYYEPLKEEVNQCISRLEH
jgi:hypothetical protein